MEDGKNKDEVIGMLKKVENDKVKDYVDKSIINNSEVRTTVDKIIAKLEDKFGVSQDIKD